ncbi:Cold-regulated protein 27 [Linum perenne]
MLPPITIQFTHNTILLLSHFSLYCFTDDSARFITPTNQHTLSLSLQQSTPMEACMQTEWTNKKHIHYLKSMEATFVDQLYGYLNIDLLPHHPKLIPQQQQHTTASGKFKVLRRGCWQKLYFQRHDDARGSLDKSPWIQHYMSARKPRVVPAHQQPSHRLHSSTCLQHDISNNYTEMSDQNFVDEDSDESEKATSTCSSSKRMKLDITNAYRIDQVVPFGKSSGIAASDVQKCMSAK